MDVFKQFDEEFGANESSGVDAVSQVVRQHTAPTAAEDDEELLEIDKCLSKAVYYKAIVRDGVLNEDGSPEVAEINAEVRTWARQQMARLVGRGPTITPTAVVSPFSDSQTSILKEIADRVLATKTGAPVVKPAPSVKRLQTTVPKKTTVAPARPVPPKPVTPSAKNKPKKSLHVPRRLADGKIDYPSIPLEETFRDDDNQLYKFVPHPQKDNTRVKMKVTNQVRSQAAVQFPMTKAQMESLSQAQAMDSLAAGASANTIFPDDRAAETITRAAIAIASQDKE